SFGSGGLTSALSTAYSSQPLRARTNSPIRLRARQKISSTPNQGERSGANRHPRPGGHLANDLLLLLLLLGLGTRLRTCAGACSVSGSRRRSGIGSIVFRSRIDRLLVRRLFLALHPFDDFRRNSI